jgi:hypothetical protein
MPVKHWNLTCDSIERPITVPPHWRDEMMLPASGTMDSRQVRLRSPNILYMKCRRKQTTRRLLHLQQKSTTRAYGWANVHLQQIAFFEL